MPPNPLPFLDPDFDNRPAKRVTASMKSITPTASPAIRNELGEIGAVLDLPPRILTRARSSAAITEATPKPPVPLWRQHVAIAVIVLSVVVGLLSRLPSKSPPLPEDLLGEWTTTLADYEEQRLGFTASEVMLWLSADAPATRHRITAVSLRGPRDSTAVSVTYSDDGSDVELHATLLLRGQPRLVFAQPVGLIWERVVSAASR